MADGPGPATAEPAAVAAPAPAAVEPAPVPVAAPAAEATPAPAAAGEVATPPKAEASPAPSSVLGDAKPAEVKPEDAAKTPEAPPAPVEPPPPITYEPFNFPETFQPAEAELSEFTELLRDNRAPQDLGQKLIDFYARELDRASTAQREYWDRTQVEWQDQCRNDPEIGGNRFDTVVKSCGRVIDEFGTPELRQVLTATGAGNHPAMVRFVNKIASVLAEGRPIPAQTPAPQAGTRAERRYKPRVNSSNG